MCYYSILITSQIPSTSHSPFIIKMKVSKPRGDNRIIITIINLI